MEEINQEPTFSLNSSTNIQSLFSSSITNQVELNNISQNVSSTMISIETNNEVDSLKYQHQ